jgi:hypothetical protein
MTTEEDFGRVISELNRDMVWHEPFDWHLLLVFSDWLRDMGDGRADGYLVLASGKYWPDRWYVHRNCWRCPENCGFRERVKNPIIPSDWYRVLPRDVQYESCIGLEIKDTLDAAARAFLKLPVERQQELLRQPVLV